MPNLQDHNKKIVRRFNKGFIEQQDDAVYRELISPEFRNHNSSTDDPKAPFLFFTRVFRTAFPDAKVVIHDLVAEGDKVVVYKNYEGTHTGEFMGMPPTGKAFSFSVMEIIKLRDGRYVDHWAVGDSAGLMRQLKAG